MAKSDWEAIETAYQWRVKYRASIYSSSEKRVVRIGFNNGYV